MKLFLKWYYWYKNFWDELLLIWVIKWIFKTYSVDTLHIQAWNEKRLKQWLKNNDRLIKPFDEKIEVVAKDVDIKTIQPDLIIFGGWEVLTDQRSFPYDGWNYLIKYRKYIRWGKSVFLWWVWTPRWLMTKILYNLTLPKAQQIVVREKKSYSTALAYNENVILHRDFAQDVVEYLSTSIKLKEDQDYILINLNSYISNKKSLREIKSFISNYYKHTKYYVPFDIENDMKYYYILKKDIPELELYDWTKNSLEDTLNFFANAEAWIGARLHFLLLLYWFNKRLKPLFYQEKIYKFFDNNIKL